MYSLRGVTTRRRTRKYDKANARIVPSYLFLPQHSDSDVLRVDTVQFVRSSRFFRNQGVSLAHKPIKHSHGRSAVICQVVSSVYNTTPWADWRQWGCAEVKPNLSFRGTGRTANLKSDLSLPAA